MVNYQLSIINYQLSIANIPPPRRPFAGSVPLAAVRTDYRRLVLISADYLGTFVR